MPVSEFPEDLKILGIEANGIARPGRIYAHPDHGHDRWYVAFTPIGDQFPAMFLYVPDFAAAVMLVREIARDYKAGNVDRFIGRWKRECEEAQQRASRAPER